jgi:type IV pilus assembly protein PilA
VGKLRAGKKSIPPLSETTLMKPELQAKFLQHLNKKNQDEGFTLIELLVVIIIIGILAAIALPNFLNQSAKAKQSEAKQNIGVINRTQTAYRTENTSFANSFDVLAIGTLTGSGTTASTTNYSYTLAGGQDSATIIATAQDTSLKAYSGGNYRGVNTSSESVISSVACEANTPGTTTAVPPTVTALPPTCPGTYKTLGK